MYMFSTANWPFTTGNLFLDFVLLGAIIGVGWTVAELTIKGICLWIYNKYQKKKEDAFDSFFDTYLKQTAEKGK